MQLGTRVNRARYRDTKGARGFNAGPMKSFEGGSSKGLDQETCPVSFRVFDRQLEKALAPLSAL